MRHAISIWVFLCALLVAQQLQAQPPLRRAEQEKKKEAAVPELSVRAKAQYTGQVAMPEELIWKREIYRTLDLNEAKNSPLYYPVEPLGDRMNLFTYLFRLLAEGKIPAYEYRLDGTEVFAEESKMNFRDMLDRFHIYYEEVVEGKDTLLRIDNSDIPSSEVLSFFIKENWYFDQRSSTMNAKVTAICPVLHRAGDFSMDIVKSPMFWLNYDDLAPYLTRLPVMTSDLNNTSNLNADDYFVSRMYKGDIYKTTNMLGRTLSQYCPTDSAMQAEQARIEGQLKAFDDNLWDSTRGLAAEELAAEAPADTALAVAEGKEEAKVVSVRRNSKKVGRDRAEEAGEAKAAPAPKREKASKKDNDAPKAKAAPRVSVRRERH